MTDKVTYNDIRSLNIIIDEYVIHDELVTGTIFLIPNPRCVCSKNATCPQFHSPMVSLSGVGRLV